MSSITALRPGRSALKRLLILALLVPSLTNVSRAQTPPARPGPAPPQNPVCSFGGEVNAVEIDVIGTDKDGKVVRGLNRDDFEIREEGKPQQIDVAAFV